MLIVKPHVANWTAADHRVVLTQLDPPGPAGAGRNRAGGEMPCGQIIAASPRPAATPPEHTTTAAPAAGLPGISAGPHPGQRRTCPNGAASTVDSVTSVARPWPTGSVAWTQATAAGRADRPVSRDPDISAAPREHPAEPRPASPEQPQRSLSPPTRGRRCQIWMASIFIGTGPTSA